MVRFPFRRATFERTLWTVVVWFLFGVFVLRPVGRLSLLPSWGPCGPSAATPQFLFGSPLSLACCLWILGFALVIETSPYRGRARAAVLVKLAAHRASAARSLEPNRLHVF